MPRLWLIRRIRFTIEHDNKFNQPESELQKFHVKESKSPVRRSEVMGYWAGDCQEIDFLPFAPDLPDKYLTKTLHVVYDSKQSRVGITTSGSISSDVSAESNNIVLLGALPPIYPEWLGDRSFSETHNLRFPYVGGAMARGITTSEMVIQLARCGALGMFGAAGLPLAVIENAIDVIGAALDPDGLSWGCNLIHSPNEPEMEAAVVDLYLRKNVRRVSASAFMSLTKSAVRYACAGLHLDDAGQVQRKNYLFAKISREEVALHFMSPPPIKMLNELVEEGLLSKEEAAIAENLPLSEDIIVESDSGGHTDNRPLNALFPAIALLKDELSNQHNYTRPIRIGAAGSLGTPRSVAAAFSLGASFVLVGTVHQGCIESGVSDKARELLAQASLSDVIMTASADMFELGVKVQVLRRGTLMGVRGNQLYDVYTRYKSIDSIPENELKKIEEQIFRRPLNDIWRETQEYFRVNDPAQLAKADAQPKHKMALLFRWYLGQSSRWPIVGDDDRIADYQIWCGPAMGAFNNWARGSFLENVGSRTVQQVALNLLHGATVITRLNQIRSFGVEVNANAYSVKPTLRSLN